MANLYLLFQRGYPWTGYTSLFLRPLTEKAFLSEYIPFVSVWLWGNPLFLNAHFGLRRLRLALPAKTRNPCSRSHSRYTHSSNIQRRQQHKTKWNLIPSEGHHISCKRSLTTYTTQTEKLSQRLTWCRSRRLKTTKSLQLSLSVCLLKTKRFMESAVELPDKNRIVPKERMEITCQATRQSKETFACQSKRISVRQFYSVLQRLIFLKITVRKQNFEPMRQWTRSRSVRAFGGNSPVVKDQSSVSLILELNYSLLLIHQIVCHKQTVTRATKLSKSFPITSL